LWYIDRERDIHNCTQDKHVGGGINAFNSSPRGVLFFKVRIIVANEVAEETSIVLDVRIGGTRKTIRVQAITVWFVVLFVLRIVN
jgi:hypothetical protein